MSSEVRVEPLEDRDQICQLVNGVWAAQYQGSPLVPKWTPEFFDWQFLRVPDQWAAVCLGIYCNDELVGTFCGDCWSLLMDGQEARATLLSCVSVKAEARHPAIAQAGLNGLREWSERQGAHYFIGFVNPQSSHGAGRRYWTTRRAYVHAFSTLSRQWQINPMTVPDTSDTTDIRVSDDLDGAVALLTDRFDALNGGEIAMLRCPESRLRHQLSFDPIGRSVVVEDRGETGVCSFYVLPTHREGHIGYFDYIASSDADGTLASKAFARAIAEMRNQRCERAFTLGQPIHSDVMLEHLGFHPCFPSYAPLIVSWDETRALPKEGAFCSPIYR